MVDKDEAYRSWERGFAGPKPKPVTTGYAEIGDPEDPTVVTVVTTDSAQGQIILPPKAPTTKAVAKNGKGKKRGS